jgi:hypothetical protein
LFNAASTNLFGRAIRGEAAYPGLRRLIQNFYASARGECPPPITAEEAIAVADARDAILAAADLFPVRGEGQFDGLLKHVAHFEKPPSDSYFSKKDYKRKWENLHCEMFAGEEKAWLESQLASTAYAARQVGDYLQAALYRDESPGKRLIFFTNGRYTAMLRRDWQLHESSAGSGEDEEDQGSARLAKKDRTDHRHHAVDAVVIALTSTQIIQQAAAAWARSRSHLPYCS